MADFSNVTLGQIGSREFEVAHTGQFTLAVANAPGSRVLPGQLSTSGAGKFDGVPTGNTGLMDVFYTLSSEGESDANRVGYWFVRMDTTVSGRKTPAFLTVDGVRMALEPGLFLIDTRFGNVAYSMKRGQARPGRAGRTYSISITYGDGTTQQFAESTAPPPVEPPPPPPPPPPGRQEGLRPWEVEYIVAPVFDATGIVGEIGPRNADDILVPFRMPLPCYSPNLELPPFPHIVEAFTAHIEVIQSDPGDQATPGQWIVVDDSAAIDPKTGQRYTGELPVIRPWDHVYIQRGPVAMPAGTRGRGWTERRLQASTYTVSNVSGPLLETAEGAQNRFGAGFQLAETDRFDNEIGYDHQQTLTMATLQKGDNGKLFPRGGYRISWPWTEDGPHKDANRWVVYKREHDAFGFIGYTETTTGEGTDRRAVFVDPGIPPDLAMGPPVRDETGVQQVVEEDNEVKRSWPGVSGRYAQRTILGGYEHIPAELKFSSPGRVLDFFTSIPGQDTDSFTRELASRRGTEVRHLLESSGLLVLTSSGEWSIAGSQGTLTPSTAQASAVSYIGSSHVPPIVLDDRVLFVNRPGTRIYSVQQEQELGRLDVQEITTLARTLFDDPYGVPEPVRGMAWSDDERLLLMITASKLLSCTYIPEGNLVAFAEHTIETQGNEPLEFADIAIVRRRSQGRNAQYRDHAYLSLHVGRSRSLRIVRLPLRTAAAAPEQLDDNIYDQRDLTHNRPVKGVLQTFSFSPQTRHGRDPGDDPAYAAEWFEGNAIPFVEASNAGVKVGLSSARQPPPWPRHATPGDSRVIAYGDAQPTGSPLPSVVAEYEGGARVDVLNVGVTNSKDDLNESGFPIYYLGDMPVWVSSDQRNLLSRDAQGNLVKLLDDQIEVLQQGYRYIRDIVYAPMSKMLFLVLGTFFWRNDALISLTVTDKGLAWAEHNINGYFVRNVTVMERNSGHTTTRNEYLYLTLQSYHGPNAGDMYVGHMVLAPEDNARDVQWQARIPRVDLIPAEGLVLPPGAVGANDGGEGERDPTEETPPAGPAVPDPTTPAEPTAPTEPTEPVGRRVIYSFPSKPIPGLAIWAWSTGAIYYTRGIDGNAFLGPEGPPTNDPGYIAYLIRPQARGTHELNDQVPADYTQRWEAEVQTNGGAWVPVGDITRIQDINAFFPAVSDNPAFFVPPRPTQGPITLAFRVRRHWTWDGVGERALVWTGTQQALLDLLQAGRVDEVPTPDSLTSDWITSPTARIDGRSLAPEPADAS